MRLAREALAPRPRDVATLTTGDWDKVAASIPNVNEDVVGPLVNTGAALTDFLEGRSDNEAVAAWHAASALVRRQHLVPLKFAAAYAAFASAIPVTNPRSLGARVHRYITAVGAAQREPVRASGAAAAHRGRPVHRADESGRRRRRPDSRGGRRLGRGRDGADARERKRRLGGGEDCSLRRARDRFALAPKPRAARGAVAAHPTRDPAFITRRGHQVAPLISLI